MATNILALLSDGILSTPDGIGNINDITIEVDVITTGEA